MLAPGAPPQGSRQYGAAPGQPRDAAGRRGAPDDALQGAGGEPGAERRGAACGHSGGERTEARPARRHRRGAASLRAGHAHPLVPGGDRLAREGQGDAQQPGAAAVTQGAAGGRGGRG